jgi:hypothetical protein
MGLFVLLFTSGISMAVEQQDVNNQEQTMTLAQPSSQPNADKVIVPPAEIIKRLHLAGYEAAVTGDLSLCQEDPQCLFLPSIIKSYQCAGKICETGDIKSFSSCFEISKEEQEKTGFVNKEKQFSDLICPFLKSDDSSDEFLNFIGKFVNEGTKDSGYANYFMIKIKAFYYALQGSESSCVGYIKKKVGEYGPQWTNDWYGALSGCRILAHEATREQEEKDYLTWIKVDQGTGSCAEIMDKELRKACNAPGVKFPSEP